MPGPSLSCPEKPGPLGRVKTHSSPCRVQHGEYGFVLSLGHLMFASDFDIRISDFADGIFVKHALLA
jgi:hypothetical protein